MNKIEMYKNLLALFQEFGWTRYQTHYLDGTGMCFLPLPFYVGENGTLMQTNTVHYGNRSSEIAPTEVTEDMITDALLNDMTTTIFNRVTDDLKAQRKKKMIEYMQKCISLNLMRTKDCVVLYLSDKV